ncbi:hypothetical protein H4R35_002224 [Dimargaris xerosporica]|nr:hypothetical protein H4R35_002224 [Dimargaris xerosporica]
MEAKGSLPPPIHATTHHSPSSSSIGTGPDGGEVIFGADELDQTEDWDGDDVELEELSLFPDLSNTTPAPIESHPNEKPKPCSKSRRSSKHEEPLRIQLLQKLMLEKQTLLEMTEFYDWTEERTKMLIPFLEHPNSSVKYDLYNEINDFYEFDSCYEPHYYKVKLSLLKLAIYRKVPAVFHLLQQNRFDLALKVLRGAMVNDDANPSETPYWRIPVEDFVSNLVLHNQLEQLKTMMADYFMDFLPTQAIMRFAFAYWAAAFQYHEMVHYLLNHFNVDCAALRQPRGELHGNVLDGAAIHELAAACDGLRSHYLNEASGTAWTPPRFSEALKDFTRPFGVKDQISSYNYITFVNRP